MVEERRLKLLKEALYEELKICCGEFYKLLAASTHVKQLQVGSCSNGIRLVKAQAVCVVEKVCVKVFWLVSEQSRLPQHENGKNDLSFLLFPVT